MRAESIRKIMTSQFTVSSPRRLTVV